MNRLLYRIVCTLLFASCVNYTVAQSSPVDISYQLCENFRIANEKVLPTPKNPYIIYVNNQSDLASLNNEIISAINKGKKSIEVYFSIGVYYYEERTVHLKNINAPDVSIAFVGEPGAILVAGGRDYKSGRSISDPTRDAVFLDDNRNIIELYGEVFESLSNVEILDEESKSCRIKVGEPVSYSRGMKIQLSEWYKSHIYDITKVSGGYIYFIASDLKYDKLKKCFNVQYDKAVSSLNPRYRLVEPSLVQNINKPVHECRVSQFLFFDDVKLRSVSISGIEWNGCGKGSKALFYFKDVDTDLLCVENCHLEHLNSLGFKLDNVNGFVFKNNSMKECYYGAVSSDVNSSNIIVKDNEFCRMGRIWTNNCCVKCYGRDFVVANNVFQDIGYVSICTGLHTSLGSQMVTRGVIEGNNIFFSDEYYSNCKKYTLIDGGAIYISTLSDQVIVRFNYIHNYRGAGSMRGVYCDDGAMNVKIYGNVICGITNSHSILSWRDESKNKEIPQTNNGIDVYYNVIWGKYKLDERPRSTCVHGKNIILYDEGKTAPENILNNFAYQEHDVFVSGAKIVDGKIKLTSEGLKELKALPTYPRIKQWFYESNTRPIKIRM